MHHSIAEPDSARSRAVASRPEARRLAPDGVNRKTYGRLAFTRPRLAMAAARAGGPQRRPGSAGQLRRHHRHLEAERPLRTALNAPCTKIPGHGLRAPESCSQMTVTCAA